MSRLLTLLLATLTVTQLTQSADRPNILLILSDDHSVPHLGAYGDPNCLRFELTPNLDALAQSGMRFERAYTTAPQCAPSRASLFAGRSPIGLSVTRFAQPMKSTTVLLTDLLRQDGYWVGLTGRHQHLDGKNRDAPHIQTELETIGVQGEAFESRFDYFVRSERTKGEALTNVPKLLTEALDQVPQGKPFFLYFGFNQPHRKWGQDHEGIDPQKLTLPKDWPDLPETRLDYARYLAEVRELDTGIGMILSTLKKHGLADKTLVIFMGDNGEALLRGKGTLYTRGLHVPLLVRWPGTVQSNTTCQDLISGEDLAPTLLDVADIESPSEMTGQSFLPALLGQPYQSRTHVFSERGWHWGPITRSDGLDLSRSVTTAKFHFIYNALPDRPYTPVDMAERNIAWNAIKQAHESGSLSTLHERLYFQTPRPIFELYDLGSDPHQLNNLAGQPALQQVESHLRESLDRWMVREGDFLPLPTHAHQIVGRENRK